MCSPSSMGLASGSISVIGRPNAILRIRIRAYVSTITCNSAGSAGFCRQSHCAASSISSGESVVRAAMPYPPRATDSKFGARYNPTASIDTASRNNFPETAAPSRGKDYSRSPSSPAYGSAPPFAVPEYCTESRHRPPPPPQACRSPPPRQSQPEARSPSTPFRPTSGTAAFPAQVQRLRRPHLMLPDIHHERCRSLRLRR